MRTTISTQKLALLAATVLFVLPSQAAIAASFDCRQASIAAEKAICGNPNLSQLDARTAGMYFTILGATCRHQDWLRSRIANAGLSQRATPAPTTLTAWSMPILRR